jgi:hypothetical protein
MKHKFPISKEYIEEEYFNKGRSSEELAKEHGCSNTTFHQYRRYFNIPKKQIFEDLTGRQFHGWTVLNKIDVKDKHGYHKIKWLCQCECGALKEKSSGALVNIGKVRGKQCKKCSGLNMRSTDLIRQTDWMRIVDSAKKRNIELTITKEYLEELLIQQDKKCALSGIPIYFSPVTNLAKEGTASLDRIDSRKGYIAGNCQFTHKICNWMKQSFDEKTFLQFCKHVADYNK